MTSRALVTHLQKLQSHRAARRAGGAGARARPREAQRGPRSAGRLGGFLTGHLPWDGDFHSSVPTGDNEGCDHTEAHGRAPRPEASPRTPKPGPSAGAPTGAGRRAHPVAFAPSRSAGQLRHDLGVQQHPVEKPVSRTFREHAATTLPGGAGVDGRGGAGRRHRELTAALRGDGACFPDCTRCHGRARIRIYKPTRFKCAQWLISKASPKALSYRE